MAICISKLHNLYKPWNHFVPAELELSFKWATSARLLVFLFASVQLAASVWEVELIAGLAGFMGKHPQFSETLSSESQLKNLILFFLFTSDFLKFEVVVVVTDEMS